MGSLDGSLDGLFITENNVLIAGVPDDRFSAPIESPAITDREFLEILCAPLPVPDVHEVHAVLKTPLTRKLPYHWWSNDLDADLLAYVEPVTPVTSQLADCYLIWIDLLRRHPIFLTGSDKLFIPLWSAIIQMPLQLFADILDFSSLEVDRNSMDESVPINRHWPGSMCYINDVIVLKGEEKGIGTKLYAVRHELEANLEPMSPELFGRLSYVFCYAAAGYDMQFFIQRYNRHLQPVSPVINLKTPIGRIRAFHIVINMFRIMRSMPALLPDAPVRLYNTKARNAVVTVDIHACIVRKTIPEINNWAYSTEAVLNTIYTSLLPVDGCSPAPLGPPFRRGDAWVVELSPLGWHAAPKDYDELRSALWSVLKVLERLHGAGIVHRDVRWDNVLRHEDGWMLIDYEMANVANAAVTTWMVMWPEECKYAGARFGPEADIFMVGEMAREWILRLLHLPGRCPFTSVISAMAHHDPAQRPCASAALSALQQQ